MRLKLKRRLEDYQCSSYFAFIPPLTFEHSRRLQFAVCNFNLVVTPSYMVLWCLFKTGRISNQNGTIKMFTKEVLLVLRVTVLLSSLVSGLHAGPVGNVTEEPATTSTTSTTSPPTQTGFKPSFPILESVNNETELVKKRAGRFTRPTGGYLPVRKFDKNGASDAVPGDFPLTAVVNHFHGNMENDSAINYYPAVDPEEARLEKPPRVYYGDFTKRPALPPPQGVDYMEADDGKANEADQSRYYYPKNLPNKPGPYDQVNGVKRGRPHASHNMHASQQTGEDLANQPGQTQLHGQISVSAGLDAHPFPHLHHHHHSVHHAPHAFRDYGHHHGHQYYHANPIGPVIGRALQLLIPSALLITGASALFPNRVHVSTNDAPAQKRNKRSTGTDGSFGARTTFDDIPSEYLRPEHRSDDEGIPLYEDDEEEEEAVEPTPAAPFGERMPSESSYATPMPTSQNTNNTSTQPITSIPVIKANKMVPAENTESDDYDLDEDIKKLNSSEEKASPMEVMSKLLQASLHPPAPSAPKKPVTKPDSKKVIIYSSVVPEVRRYDTSITNNEKPFFRPLSTESPARIVVVTPVTNSVIEEPQTAKIVQRREVDSNATLEASASGPPVVELGGEGESETEVNGTAALLNRTEVTNEIGDLHDVDLSPDSPVVGLLTNYAAREEETPACQKRALCELAIRGSKEGATKFERFLWNLANLVPPSLSMYYDLQDTFTAIQNRKCFVFICANPNLDLQEVPLPDKSSS